MVDESSTAPSGQLKGLSAGGTVDKSSTADPGLLRIMEQSSILNFQIGVTPPKIPKKVLDTEPSRTQFVVLKFFSSSRESVPLNTIDQVGIEDETRKFRSQEEELLRLKEELDKLKQGLKTLNDNLKSENINKNTLLQVSSLAFS